MISPKLSLSRGWWFAVVAVLTFTSRVFPQVVAYDDAGNYRISASWTNLSNQGFGFTPWAIVTNGPNSHGTYIGSGNNPAFVIASITNVSSINYTDVFGLFANGSTGTNETLATRGFSAPLGTNTFKLQWGSRGAGVTTVITNQITNQVHGWCGFTLRNGNATNSSGDFQTGVRFYLYFLDGAVPSTLYIWDNDGVQSVPGTSFSNLGRGNITNAVQSELTPGADGSSYHLVLKDCVQNKTLWTHDGTLIGSGSVDSAALFCHETTGDQIYNRMQIAVPTLVPPTISNFQPTNGSIYVDPSSTVLSFEVDSFNSTIASNFVSVYLNGVLKSGSTFNTTGPTNQLLGTNSTPLVANTFYTFGVVAQDANGNVVSNSINFNTFSSSNMCIDVMDYNYGAGQFIPNPAIAQYAGLLGTNGIDYLDVTTLTNSNDYRPGDAPLPQLLLITVDALGDTVDHEGFIASSTADYQLAFTDQGEWENYTRSFPASNYTVYARGASAGGGQFQVDQLANSTATTSNQSLAILGTVVVPVTGGSKIYSGQLQPLADMLGNTVNLRLNGTTTLRVTATQSRTFNLSYLMFVPNTNTAVLKPYISVGSPAPGASSIALDSPISFSIANRQTAVNPATIKLSLNGSDVTSGLVLSNNAAGSTVSYSPSVFLPPNATNTLVAIFNDNTGTNSVTNTWTFTTLNQALTTLTNALPLSTSTNSGFALSLYKIDNAGPEPNSTPNALLQLRGQVINGITGFPWTNTINNTFVAAPYIETNVIDYDITGTNTGTFTFPTKSPFPLIPTGNELNFVMQALFYLQLSNGSYHIAVRSDDGFELDSGPNPATTPQLLGIFNGGRANTTPSDIFITATNIGTFLYPMNLLYYQESLGGSIEFYTVKNGISTLVNDSTSAGAIKAFLYVPPRPTISSIVPNGSGQVIISGTNNVGTSGTYKILTSTSLDTPLVSWTVLANGTFDLNGSFSSTNAVGAGNQFFAVQVP